MSNDIEKHWKSEMDDLEKRCTRALLQYVKVLSRLDRNCLRRYFLEIRNDIFKARALFQEERYIEARALQKRAAKSLENMYLRKQTFRIFDEIYSMHRFGEEAKNLQLYTLAMAHEAIKHLDRGQEDEARRVLKIILKAVQEAKGLAVLIR